MRQIFCFRFKNNIFVVFFMFGRKEDARSLVSFSCFFCPSMKPREIRALYHQYPELLERALAIEDNAQPNLRTVRGLGRDFAWRDFILADEAQLTLPEAFSADDLPCSCSVSG